MAKGKIPVTINLDKYDVLIQNSMAPFKEKHFSYLILSSSPTPADHTKLSYSELAPTYLKVFTITFVSLLKKL